MNKLPVFKQKFDPYLLLGVSPDATQQQVDDAYRARLEEMDGVETEELRFSWKALRDRIYRKLWDSHRSPSYLYDAGFFIDNLSADEVEQLHADPNLITTPVHKIVANLKQLKKGSKPVILLTTGGFSPIHYGHIAMMESAKFQLEQNGYTVVGGYVSPSHDAYVSTKYGGEAELDCHHRIFLARQALLEHEWLMVDPWESRYVATDINFTDVLYRLREYVSQVLKDQPDVEIFYVFGSDNAKFVRVFQEDFGCVCVGRETSLNKKIQNERGVKNNPRIFFTQHNNGYHGFSSSAARKWKTALMSEMVSSTYFKWRKNLLFESTIADRPRLLYVIRDEDNWAIESWFKKGNRQSLMRAKARFQEGLEQTLHDAFLNANLPDLPQDVQMRTYHLDEQKSYVDRLKRKEQILNLDACTADSTSIQVSREFALADGQMHPVQLIGRPGTASIQSQIKKIKPGTYTLLDDDIASGTTINMLMGMLPEKVQINKIRTITNNSRKVFLQRHPGQFDQEPYDVIDIRDFILGAKSGGLVVQLPNNQVARAPYMEPFISLATRAKIPPSMEMICSKRIWELNEIFFADTNLTINDFDPFARTLFVYLGFSPKMLVVDLCRWHLEQIWRT